MDCQACREYLSPLQAHELEADREREVQAHLETCEDCRKELQNLKQLDQMIQKLPQHKPADAGIINVKMQTVMNKPEENPRMEFGPVMNLSDLAAYLRVSRETVEEYIEEIPCFQFGDQVLFRRKSVEEWIEQREQDFGLQKLESQVNRILAAEDFI